MQQLLQTDLGFGNIPVLAGGQELQAPDLLATGDGQQAHVVDAFVLGDAAGDQVEEVAFRSSPESPVGVET